MKSKGTGIGDPASQFEGTENKSFTHPSNIRKELSSQIEASLSSQEKLSLSAWGLPEKVLEYYHAKGITHMFRWQLECLSLGDVLDSGNLVYSAPTSAGKTLVAEILISKTLFELQKKALVILPFVSVVREKMFYFQGMYSSSGIHVEGYMGGHTPSISFKQVNVAVCTIEKANAIINRLLEEQDLQNLGLVVVDELHLLGDPYRGYLLELLLTKLKYISSRSDYKIQIVGMSATLPNLKSLADWLHGSLYYTDFRPVPLNEKLKCGNAFYDKELNKLSEFTMLPSEASDDSENVGQLCVETIANGHSILIFCPTKVWCETLADKIALFFRRNGCSKSAEIEGTPGWILRKQLNLKKINDVIEHLKMSPVGLDKDLHKTVAYGVAFHHAGLTLDERDIIEGSFRQGSIRVLCATSTLSSGVNLPARRVIIRSPMSFGGLMDILTYRQMIGRAGRMGVDSEGESILICKPNEKPLCQSLMCSTLKPIESCLGHGRLSASLKRALLEIIASGIASSPEEVKQYTSCTYLAFSSKHNIEDPIKSCIDFLEENEFIRLQENGSIFTPTPLGKACLASSLPPDEGLALFRELQRARRCFVLDTDLHIIYQVTPYSVSEQWSKVDWLNVLNILESLPPSMKRVGEMVGVEEGFLVRVAKGRININDLENRNKLSIHRRFYTSLALQDLVNEIPLSTVAEKYECNKGMLQSLQQSAATYAGMVTEFTKCLGWNSVELIFSQFQERLQFGIRRELCDLMRLPLLNAARARVLFNAGFTNLAIVANANVTDLENAFFAMVPFQSKKEIAGETKYEKEKRNKLEAIWITGKADLSIRQAAELLLAEARNILELELGLENAKWGKKESESMIKSPNKSLNQSLRRSVVVSKSQAPEQVEPQVLQSKEENANSNNSITKNPLVECDSLNNQVPVCDNSIVSECREVPEEKNSEKNLNVGKEEAQNLSVNIEGLCECDDGKRAEKKLEEMSENEKVDGIVEASNNEKCINGNLSSSSVKKEEFNFTSSYIFHMIPDYITEKLNDEVKLSGVVSSNNENVNTSNVSNENFIIRGGNDYVNSNNHEDGDADSISSDLECPQSSEVFCDSRIQNSSKILSLSRLSEDMFDKEPGSSKKMSTPIQSQSVKRLSESGKSRLAEISSPDLFSQSLTFDTQMGRILDFEEEPVLREGQAVANPSNSFNSDDLGFVSDLSPQKMKKLDVSADKKPETSSKSDDGNLPGGSLSFFDRVVRGKGLEVENGGREAVKRKIESPDLIIDSGDECDRELHRLTKRVKCNAGEGRVSDSPVPTFVNESDDEILPTPKIDPRELSSISNIKRPCCGSLRSFNRSFLRRASQKTKMLSQNATKPKKGSSQLRKGKSEMRGIQMRDMKVSTKSSFKTEKIIMDRINVIDVCDREQEFRFFCEKLTEQNIVGLALGCRRKVEEKKNLIGSRIMKRKKTENATANSSDSCHHKDVVLDGIAFYWRENDVYYMSLDDRVVPVTEKLSFLKNFCHKKNTFRMFDVREQIKMLSRCCSVFLTSSYQDPKVGFWLLSELWKEKNFTSMVQEYLPGCKNLISQIGSVVGFSSPGLLSKSSSSPKTRACVEAFLTYHMIDHQLPLLQARGLEQAFVQTEMPVITCLAEMELHGFGICRKTILEIKDKLDTIQETLEAKAFSLASHKFSLSSSSAISKVLFKELNLDSGNLPVTKKRKVISTSKQVLEELVEETKHPLPHVILQWRKVRSISSKFVSFLLQTSLESDRIFGVSQTYTVTGRISMHEPNLQNTPKTFTISDGLDEEIAEINLRDAFVPSDTCLLISADYCQIELRILAHLSGDEELIKNITEADDIFVNIAANVYGIPLYEVDEILRQRAKQTSYGMIYGIGAKTLSQQLGLDEANAAILLENFKNKYAGVKKFVEDTINECRKTGYVTTLLGRRRYLTAIKDSNPAVRTEAERQAINTKVQGSAADLVKITMITCREKIQSFISGGVTVHPVLHLHDELIFEVQKDSVEGVAALLKETMEAALELVVPTPVRIKVGPSWGQLKNYDF